MEDAREVWSYKLDCTWMIVQGVEEVIKCISTRTGEAVGEVSKHFMDRLVEIWLKWRSKHDEFANALIWSYIVSNVVN